MQAFVRMLLGISLLAFASEAVSARFGEVASAAATASRRDSCFAPTNSGRFHDDQRWARNLPSSTAGDTLQPLWMPRRRIPETRTFPAGPTAPSAQVAMRDLPGTDGNVTAIARAGNTLYIAGSFRSMGENSGGLVQVDGRTGEQIRTFPKVAGAVTAIVPDGSGGWYIGGEFSGVGGKPRLCLAQLRPDGSVSDWNPGVSGSPGYIDPPTVLAMAVCGNRLFVGGAFREIGGRPHENLGCVDLRSGQVLDWDLDTNIDEPVVAFAVHGDTVFVGGRFSTIGGTPRGSLAAVSASTGSILPWQADLYGGASALLAYGDTLYVGGDFTDIGSTSAPKLAAVSISRACSLPIDFRVNGVWLPYHPLIQVAGLARANDTLYAVGNFTAIGGEARSGIAALNATTGDALAWSPDTTGPRSDGDPPPLCTTVAVRGPRLYIGGYYGSVNGAYHPLVAAWDRQTGRVLDWTPNPDEIVATFAGSDDTLYLGGFFHLFGAWQHRAGLAAIDLGTGRLKPWNPNPNGGICTAIAVSGDRVLVSGDFSSIGGDPQPRNYFAALDTVDGEATSWDPGANDVASVFLLAGDTLYAGGEFTQVGGQPRNAVVAIDTNTGDVFPWDPSANSSVLALARSGDKVFLGGLFTRVNGEQRLGLAAVDANTGVLSPWNPGTDNSAVYSLLIAGRVLYVGGAFGVVGGQQRRALAALDLQSGLATTWEPSLTAWDVVDPWVRVMTLVDSVLYVGGSFGSLGGQPRVCLSGVDTTTGGATTWDPGTDGLTWSLSSNGRTMYVGGGFSRAGGSPASALAAFELAPALSPLPMSFELATCVPNPVSTTTEIRFGLPRSAEVTLSVYDPQGRRVAVPLIQSPLNAGPHAVLVDAGNWRPGVYLCRLEADGRAANRKLVILR